MKNIKSQEIFHLVSILLVVIANILMRLHLNLANFHHNVICTIKNVESKKIVWFALFFRRRRRFATFPI